MTEDRPFTTSVVAGFSEDGVWILYARLAWQYGVPPPAGSDLLAKGRLALLEEIALEAIRGRTLGAKSIRVHLDTGEGEGEYLLDDQILPDGLRRFVLRDVD